jgi:hypothetical protein
MRIPSRKRIIDVASGQRTRASAAGDTTATRHLDKLISNLNTGMRATWDAESGCLLVKSANTRGAVYRVTAERCNCPAYCDYCCHRRLYDLIMQIVARDSDGPIVRFALYAA